jgi:hypothetical protein
MVLTGTQLVRARHPLSVSWETVAVRILPGWAWRRLLRHLNRPQPELHLLGIVAHGGGGAEGGYVDFGVEVVNYGTKQCRGFMKASVGDQQVECRPSYVDLIPSTPPQDVRVIVPRPELGDLVPAFNNETTLYGQTLSIEVSANDQKYTASQDWREKVYDPETEPQRATIQKRVWRLGRGEGTEADFRAEQQSELLRRAEERAQRRPEEEFYDP